MWGALLGGLVGAGAGAGISGLMGRSNAKQQQEATKEQYQHRYQWTMGDLKAAGLNPMLAMNQGAVSGGGSMAMADTPDVSSAATSGMNAGSQRTIATATAKNLEAQTAKNNAEAGLADQQAINSFLEGERSMMENKSLRENPEAIYRQKYTGHVASEMKNVFDLSRNSAKSVIDGGSSLLKDLKTVGEGSAYDLDQWYKNYGEKHRQKDRN